jgi:hypothetical protein
MSQETNTQRYKLIAQHPDDKLLIEIIEQKLFLIRQAKDIVCDNKMIQGFSPEDAVLIGVIAGMNV